MEHMYDLVVIGAGSGGVRAARISASHGAKVAVIEGDRPGGTCVIRGCVPKKLLMYGSMFSADVEDARGFGWHVDKPAHDWRHLIAAKNTELNRLESIYVSLLENAGATLIRGFAKVTGPHNIEVNGDEITAQTILVAVGGIPQMIDVPGMYDHAITSNEALDLDNFPSEILIYGGGYIALEFAGIFNGYGAKTHLVYRGDLPLRGFDDDIRRHIAVAMQDRGIILHPGTTIDALEDNKAKKIATLSDGTKMHVNQVMAATGRKPNTDNLGLDQIGVDMGRNGEILVDAYSRTSVPSIYAVGDVTDRVNLTPVAINEGHAFADTLYGNNPRIISHENIASAVFSQPPIATVGLSEADAAKTFDKIRVYESQFRAMKNTISGRGEKTYMKLIVDDTTDKVVGAHMMGPDCGEIMQGIGIAVKAGATKADFDATIGIHPTAAEEFVTMRSPRD
ncbi:glutathione-disulfide reductase [Candidatus Puniceispirillum sp.]|uniref:glutathione-disulfide reductase n=1 Tax=Candidatus Puniceispirillum sp. TaxID=2026719 RepID=UPI001EB648DC|nr:glutathione-disulfide reductase [Candidatus Puniceispirillum sp.]